MSALMLPVAILAGGLATRLRPITATIPKALIDVNGQPFIIHQFALLRRAGIRRVVLCVGHLAEQIVAVVGDGRAFGLQVDYSLDGPTLRGTAGALRRATPLLGSHFFVLYGDSYLDCDYGAVQRAYLASGRLALMTVYRNDGRWDTSNVELSDGRLVAYDKRQRTDRMRHIDYGLGVLAADALAEVPEDRPADLATVYQALLAREQLAAFEVPTRFYEIGSPTGLADLRRHLAGRTSPLPLPPRT